jgi:hypothetical protein
MVMPIARMSAAAAFGASRPPNGPVKRGRSAIDDSAFAKPTSAPRMICSRFCRRGSCSGVIGAIAPNTSPTAASVNGASIFITSSRAGSNRDASAGWFAPACPVTSAFHVDATASAAQPNIASRVNTANRALFVVMTTLLTTRPGAGARVLHFAYSSSRVLPDRLDSWRLRR